MALLDGKNTPLLVGGGGGGANNHSTASYRHQNGWDAPATVQGTNIQGAANMVPAGTGGQANPDFPGAYLGGGGGYYSNGLGTLSATVKASDMGQGFVLGAVGGVAHSFAYGFLTYGGGFGCGAPVYFNSPAVYPGGGGGYTGGDSSRYQAGTAGGAGGSYLGTAKDASGTAYGELNSNSHGYVRITLVAPA